MEAFVDFFVDEKVVRVENIFLHFLKNYSIVDVSTKDEESASFVQDSSLANKIFGGRLQSKGAYVPPSQRAGADRRGQDMRRRNDENSVRVTNLSEDTREPDLQDLFSTFGPVSRVYIAYDQKTGMSRCFGYVNFVYKGDADKVIAKLNGYGYDNLILRVEWAAPRTN
ncbi:hypothetical protein IFM89_003544 [Coptis chinensis]|uniref:RRM domain-containing protein n=1 Tax=Coptis chinensis TaxID=261450 RepID=A0A835MBL2_9MAGN|nr:hypothetical protein IFM89_003544 [Coptis chinensis]